MENIVLEANMEQFTPFVYFNARTGVCEISGESYLEKTYAFYDPLYVWLNEYTTTVRKPLTMNFKLRYMNTSSSKCILMMLKILKDYQQQGGHVTVNWYIKKEDEVMLEEVEDLKEEAEMQINFIQVDVL
jgi:hypothetical protein